MWDEFKEFIDYLELEKNAADNTLRQRKRDLDRFSEWLDSRDVHELESVEKRDVILHVDAMVEDGYAYNTVMTAYSSVAAALGYLYREGNIERDPTGRIKRSNVKDRARDAKSIEEQKDELGEKDHLTKEEVYELAEHVPEPQDRNELLIKFLFWTGLRVSEVVRIDIGEDGTLEGERSDIDPEEPLVTVYGKKADDPRFVSYRRAEINPLLRDWVSHGRLRYKCATETQRLFIGPKGPLTESSIGDVVNKAAENMGIQETEMTSKDGREYNRVTPHFLRHSHAMHYHNEEDVPLDIIKTHLGHSSVDITEEFYAEGTAEKMASTFGG